MAAAGGLRKLQLRPAAGYFQGLFHAMGSPCELLIECDDENVARNMLELAAAEAWRIEDKFSRYLPGNIVAKINESDGSDVSVDDETAQLLDFAAKLHELSDGRFDITSGALRKVWMFDGSDRIPSAESIRDILHTIGWQRVSWQRPVIRLLPGMQIDLGGIGKEYAVDRAATLLAEQTTSPCLVNFGGDLAAIGERKKADGWQVGIDAPDSVIAAAQKLIRLQHGGLATSGDARRFLFKDGVRYSHILNPRTGWPVENAPRSITVAADTCTQAGMLTTLAMLEGLDAEAFLEQQGVRFWCLR